MTRTFDYPSWVRQVTGPIYGRLTSHGCCLEKPEHSSSSRGSRSGPGPPHVQMSASLAGTGGLKRNLFQSRCALYFFGVSFPVVAPACMYAQLEGDMRLAGGPPPEFARSHESAQHHLAPAEMWRGQGRSATRAAKWDARRPQCAPCSRPRSFPSHPNQRALIWALGWLYLDHSFDGTGCDFLDGWCSKMQRLRHLKRC